MDVCRRHWNQECVTDFKQGPCPCVEFIEMFSLHVGASICQEQHCSHRRFRWWISAWSGFIGSLIITSYTPRMSSDIRLQLLCDTAACIYLSTPLFYIKIWFLGCVHIYIYRKCIPMLECMVSVCGLCIVFSLYFKAPVHFCLFEHFAIIILAQTIFDETWKVNLFKHVNSWHIWNWLFKNPYLTWLS